MLFLHTLNEGTMHDVFPDQPCPSFQAIHWYMPKKLGEEEFDKLLELLREQLQLFGENPSLSSIAQRFLSGIKSRS